MRKKTTIMVVTHVLLVLYVDIILRWFGKIPNDLDVPK
jgi:hypothetical protein